MVDHLPRAFVRAYLESLGVLPSEVMTRYYRGCRSWHDDMTLHNYVRCLGLSHRDVRILSNTRPAFRTSTLAWSFVFKDGLVEWRGRAVMMIRMQNILVRWVRRAKAWIGSHVFRHAVVIARNRKDGVPDVRIPITYTLRGDPYFAAALAGHFSTGTEEENTFVVHVSREGTSQRVVEIFWKDYRWDRARGKAMVFAYLDERKDSLPTAIGHVHSIATRWDHQKFYDIVSEYLMAYMNTTLFSGGNSMDRLYKFATTDPRLASYIWTTNFGTEQERTQLVFDLKIALAHQKAFIRSTTLEELQANLVRKSVAQQKIRSSVYDHVPAHLWDRVEQCKKNLEIARRGVRVGWSGRYISSDDIAAAETNLNNAYKDADRWIGRNRKR